eukprot:357772-Pleurochrysis_carterae.AAC.2
MKRGRKATVRGALRKQIQSSHTGANFVLVYPRRCVPNTRSTRVSDTDTQAALHAGRLQDVRL